MPAFIHVKEAVMKKLVVLGSAVLLSSAVFAGLSTQTQKLSYTMGYKTGSALKTQSVTIDPAAFSQGLSAGYAGKNSLLSDAQMQSSLQTMQKTLVANMEQKMQQQASENQKTGAAFLETNGKKPGVVTLPSGLQYQIIQEGQGVAPKATDTVTVNYEGTLIDGQVFDSSYKRGQPATFKVNQVIKGWQEALQLMKPGATWMLYIPANLAYGDHGAGGMIGPNETLIFKVNLISVKA